MEDADMIRELENLHVLNKDFHNMDSLMNALEESIGKERSGRLLNVVSKRVSKKRRSARRHRHSTSYVHSESSPDEAVTKSSAMTHSDTEQSMHHSRHFFSSLVESDSVTESIPIRICRRRRRHKRMAVDPSPSRDQATVQSHIKGKRNKKSSKKEDSKMDVENHISIQPGKRKRGYRENNSESLDVEEMGENRLSRFLHQMSRESSTSISNSEGDSDATFSCSNDEGREADDEHSDFFHEGGTTCGVIPWWENTSSRRTNVEQNAPDSDLDHVLNAKSCLARLIGKGRKFKCGKRLFQTRCPGYTMANFLSEQNKWTRHNSSKSPFVSSSPSVAEIKRRRKTPPCSPYKDGTISPTYWSIPAYYREIHSLLSTYDDFVDYETFVKFCAKSGLSRPVLTQIWESLETKHEKISRNGLYKALAYISLAQAGKSFNEKILESYQGQELPIPSMGDMKELQKDLAKIKREKFSSDLNYSITELEQIDQVTVKLVPEKKGIILKHVEYEVYSNKYNKAVERRYNDFLALHELLLQRYPYRIIARLPPKKLLGASREFIECRRKWLARFLTICVRHPVVGQDDVIKYFLTFTGTDTCHKMKEHFKGLPDEFMTDKNATLVRNLVTEDANLQFMSSREFARQLEIACCRLKEIAERQVYRSSSYARDMFQMNKELTAIGTITTPVSNWSTGESKIWKFLKPGFQKIAAEFCTVAQVSGSQAKEEDEEVLENISLLLDVLYGYRDLCDRHEKGVIQDHQRALSKLSQYKKRKNSGSTNGRIVEDRSGNFESRILEQEEAIANLENRSFFALHCIKRETQLVHVFLSYLYTVVKSLVKCEIRAYSELASAWNKLEPLVRNLIQENAKTDT
ncbi:DgyrCDS2044 [Dimorphilus gyrociliatus]|uniref:DgyrCDS2044 n=1 Tax=Dimorphilus gyrociliatus TaxID=2664684 RepID=A0A7I8VAE9_9ANNE|nr:DgyrCDS2044 [Dimorphilus gyrociliatus]